MSDDLVKSPYAALNCIPRHCDLQEVRLILRGLRALPQELFMRSSEECKYLYFV